MYELMNPKVLFAGVLFLMLIAVVIGILMEYRFEIVKMMKEYYGGKSLMEILLEGPKLFLSGMFSALFVAVDVINALLAAWKDWKTGKLQTILIVALLILGYYVEGALISLVLHITTLALVVWLMWKFFKVPLMRFEPSPRLKITPLPTISKTPYVEKRQLKKKSSGSLHRFPPRPKRR